MKNYLKMSEKLSNTMQMCTETLLQLYLSVCHIRCDPACGNQEITPQKHKKNKNERNFF